MGAQCPASPLILLIFGRSKGATVFADFVYRFPACVLANGNAFAVNTRLLTTNVTISKKKRKISQLMSQIDDTRQ